MAEVMEEYMAEECMGVCMDRTGDCLGTLTPTWKECKVMFSNSVKWLKWSNIMLMASTLFSPSSKTCL